MKLMSYLLLPIVAFIALAAAIVYPLVGARADQREDFLAGRVKECPGCDLSGANFKRRDLTGANLAGANLRDANFHDARLIGAKLAGADFSGANLNKANLSRADAAGAKLNEAMLYGAILDAAKLAGADFSEALMGTARFLRCDLDKATLRNADMRKTRLDDAVLTGADLTGAAPISQAPTWPQPICARPIFMRRSSTARFTAPPSCRMGRWSRSGRAAESRVGWANRLLQW
jgi:Pentapeptide repeats (8 copies)